jgi:hypothetical protein
MNDLIQELKENEYTPPEDWKIINGELWVSPQTALWIVENNPLDELLINVLEE